MRHISVTEFHILLPAPRFNTLISALPTHLRSKFSHPHKTIKKVKLSEWMITRNNDIYHSFSFITRLSFKLFSISHRTSRFVSSFSCVGVRNKFSYPARINQTLVRGVPQKSVRMTLRGNSTQCARIFFPLLFFCHQENRNVRCTWIRRRSDTWHKSDTSATESDTEHNSIAIAVTSYHSFPSCKSYHFTNACALPLTVMSQGDHFSKNGWS